MMQTRRIITRLFLSHAFIGLFALLIISTLFYVLSRNALLEKASDQLASITTLKEQEIDTYFNQHEKDLKFLFTHDFFLEHFKSNLTSLTPRTFPVEVGAELSSIKSIYNFQDISVVNNELLTVYSTSGRPFEATKAIARIDPNASDFHWIDASVIVGSGKTVLLYVIPLKKNETLLGSIVVWENFDKLETLLQEHAGMGETGECYIVGPDNRLRSASRFFPEKDPLTISVREEETDVDHIRIDYRGQEVISFSQQLTNPSLKWKLVSEIDLSEAMKPVDRFRNYLLIVTIAVALVVVAVSVFSANAISKPVMYLREVIMHLGKGILPAQQVQVKNVDEVGQIADAVNALVAGLRRTTDFANEIGQGKFDGSYKSLSDKDTLGLALIDMRDQLRRINEREIRLVREKASALLEGQENERKRITLELHDGVGQLLTAIRLRVDIVPMEAGQRKELVELINETINEVKRISYNVMPGSLVDFGLEAALKGLCDHTSRYSSLKFDFRFVRESAHDIAFDVSVAVYRIVQEGINNILKHAGARHVELSVLDKEDAVYVLLKDDGKGFVENPSGTGLGLRTMRERARLLGGTVEIHSDVSDGTVVEAWIPLTRVNG